MGLLWGIAWVMSAAWALEAEHSSLQRFAAAEIVVAVDVVDVEVRAEPGVPGGVATVALSRPLGALKGQPPEVIEVILPGGRLDGFRVEVDGVPVLPVGTRWMLYLSALPSGGFGVIGAEAGAVPLHSTVSALSQLQALDPRVAR